jgi:CBS domain-containing protein
MFTKTPEDGLPTIVYTVPPDARVGEVAGLMAMKGVGAVVVVENQQPIGILTDRDIVVRVNAQMLDVEKIRVREAMSSPLVTVPKQEDVGVALALMRRHGIRRLPIVDEQGRLFSIITLDDVLLLHLAGQDDLTGIIRRQLHPDSKAEKPAGPAKDRFADLGPPVSTEHIPQPMPVALVASLSRVVAMEDIHLHRLQRDERRQTLKWVAIIGVLSLLAVGLALLASNVWVGLETTAPRYEPKDQSRQQHLEQLERDRKKKGP